jgi:Ca2+-binding EF-hand superfamily protein
MRETIKNGFPSADGSAPAKAKQGPRSETARTVDSDELQHVRNVVRRRGGDGINGLLRIFRQLDGGEGTDGDLKLTKEEFITGLQNMNVALSKEQFHRLFAQFDRNSDGTVSAEEFVRTVAGPLNKKRRAIVEGIFHTLDRSGKGVLSLSDLASRFNIFLNPDVQSGRKSGATVIDEFVRSFKSNDVTIEDFCDYYSNLSCGINADEQFELVANNTWTAENKK